MSLDEATFSTSADRLSENVRVHTVIMPELKFTDIKRQILFADLMEGPGHPALDKRPKAFNGLSMNDSNDIFSASMVNGGVRVLLLKRCLYPIHLSAQRRPALCDKASRTKPSGSRASSSGWRQTDDCRRKSDAGGFAPLTVYHPRHKVTLLRPRLASPIL
jgi:hypothetical protein